MQIGISFGYLLHHQMIKNIELTKRSLPKNSVLMKSYVLKN